MRPLLDVGLQGPGGRRTATLLVDSGSEYTIIMQGVGRATGVGLNGPTETVRMGGHALPITLDLVQMYVEGFPPTEVTVGWASRWPFETSHVGVLGQRGFFDRFYVLMDRANLRFGLASLEDGDQAFPPPPVDRREEHGPMRSPFESPPRRKRSVEDFPDAGRE